MIWNYLKKDKIGAASKIVYARKGDRVAIIDNQINMYLVISESGNKFHVREDDISSTYIEKEKPLLNEKEIGKTKKRSKK